MHTVLKIVAPALGATAFAWIIWQSVRTGMPARNPLDKPSKEGAPVPVLAGRVVLCCVCYLVWGGGGMGSLTKPPKGRNRPVADIGNHH